MTEKFQLEKIRMLSFKKLRNLIALIQLATSISNKTFAEIVEEVEMQQTTTFELSVTFQVFCHHRSLKKNRFAFTSFLSTVAPEFRPRERVVNPLQKSLFPRCVLRSWKRETAEMGVF